MRVLEGPHEGEAAMASIDKRPDGRYRARWREYPGGPQKTRSSPARATPSASSTPSAATWPMAPTSTRRWPDAVSGLRGAVADRPGPPTDDGGGGRDLPASQYG